MTSHTIITRTDDTLTLHQTDDGRWCCPVCGSPELTQPPYFDDGAASYEMCSCGFEFGFDDDPGASAQALPTVTENVQRWRCKLLARVQGDGSRYAKLQAQLASIGITDTGV